MNRARGARRAAQAQARAYRLNEGRAVANVANVASSVDGITGAWLASTRGLGVGNHLDAHKLSKM